MIESFLFFLDLGLKMCLKHSYFINFETKAVLEGVYIRRSEKHSNVLYMYMCATTLTSGDLMLVQSWMNKGRFILYVIYLYMSFSQEMG